MPDTPSVTVNKMFQYRGKSEVWSNKYHFSGTTPADAAAWKTLADAIWAQEKTFLGAGVSYVGFLGHEAGNEFAVANRDFVAEGATLDQGLLGTQQSTLPGDVAVWVRWKTNERTSRGKWIYLRKTFHGVPVTGDTIPTSTKTPMLAYGAKMKDGTLPGGAKICGPQGAEAGLHSISPFASFRQLKRTGKRPSR